MKIFDPLLETYSLEMVTIGGVTAILVIAIAIKLLYRFFTEITE